MTGDPYRSWDLGSTQLLTGRRKAFLALISPSFQGCSFPFRLNSVPLRLESSFAFLSQLFFLGLGFLGRESSGFSGGGCVLSMGPSPRTLNLNP